MDVLKWFIGVSILLLALTLSVCLLILTIGSVDVDNIERFDSLANNTVDNVDYINDRYDMSYRNADFVGRNGIEDASEFQKTIDEWVRAE